MSRIVKIYKKKPYEIQSPAGSLYICQCGLSKKIPFCDGRHTFCVEEDDKTYRYDEEGNRMEVADT